MHPSRPHPLLHPPQDLSRLSVIVPYTSHIFESVMQSKKTFRRQGSIDGGRNEREEEEEDEEEGIFVKPLLRK